jgi:pyridinium-3,5-bisthiocarboxylic acid mononucleotide nickel chelatase
MKTLYFDCFSGIAGDMTIGALLDLGLDFEYLKSELRKLPVDGYELKSSRVVRANISAVKFDVLMHAGHDHDHDHGDHHHDHSHGHAHFHRKASEILSMIRDSGLNANTKRIATRIFTKLAVSEGRVHHMPPEDVEFHEVGAIDSIVDTVGTAIGLDALEVERFLCGAINVGAGFIHCQHGIYPVPTPATADLLREATIYSKHADTELVTPTGAAILAAVVERFTPLDSFSIQRIGYGAGTKQFKEFPNCVRLLLGEERAIDRSPSVHVPAVSGLDEITVIEANIDDMTPQNFGYVTERLLESGALDVFTVPIQMKKGRPGHLLQVLSPVDRAGALSRILFEETTTIGLRQHSARRTILERDLVTVETEFGKIAVKVSKLDGRTVTYTPEYEDCARQARAHGVPLKTVQSAALKSYLLKS